LTSAPDLTQFVRDRDVNLQLQPTRVSYRQSVAELQAGSMHLPPAQEGETREVPLWVANVLGELGLAEVQEEPFEMELFKALSRERIAPAQQLAALRADFYPRLRRFLLALKRRVARNPELGSDQLRATISARDLVSLRLSKLLHFASGTSFASDLLQKLAPEERRLFEEVRSLVEEWRTAVLEAPLP
jgi:hypothetical protein